MEQDPKTRSEPVQQFIFTELATTMRRVRHPGRQIENRWAHLLVHLFVTTNGPSARRFARDSRKVWMLSRAL
jgi:hypothetical protein